MYEKPQYLTKNGYKRLNKNPCKNGVLPVNKTAMDGLSQIKRKIPSKGKGISDEAAKMIAIAFKGMLKD
jgi:hypothetical protein